MKNILKNIFGPLGFFASIPFIIFVIGASFDAFKRYPDEQLFIMACGILTLIWLGIVIQDVFEARSD